MKRHNEALYDAKELTVNEDIRREYVERVAKAMQELNTDRTPQVICEERTKILLQTAKQLLPPQRQERQERRVTYILQHG
jgi:hypothetical protein